MIYNNFENPQYKFLFFKTKFKIMNNIILYLPFSQAENSLFKANY